jgi:hypothetical protein
MPGAAKAGIEQAESRLTSAGLLQNMEKWSLSLVAAVMWGGALSAIWKNRA